MICSVYEEELSSYLDGELPVVQVARLEAHLKVCPHCQAELEAMGSISLRLKSASRLIEVSHDFDRRVLRAVGYFRITGWQRPVRSYLRPLLVTMATLLAMFATVWAFYIRPLEPPPVWSPQPALPVAAPAGPVTPPPADTSDNKRTNRLSH